MILKKPYAFFIKMFKPMHLLLGFFIAYLIYLHNKILNFLSNYIYSSTTDVLENVSKEILNAFLYIIPILVIVMSILILSIMFKKKKQIVFYLVNIFSFIAILVITFYASKTIQMLETSVLSISTVKLIYDLMRLSIVIDGIMFTIFIVRGMGIDFKKFNFESEVTKLQITAEDNEEFELDFNVDLNESKRRRRRNLRFIKYAYIENKFLINCISIILICVISVIIYYIHINNRLYKEGIFYSMETINFKVDSTTVTNSDFKGNKITDNYLIIVDTQINSYLNKNIYLKDIFLNIEGVIFYPTTKFSDKLSDMGNVYNEEMLNSSFNNYLFVFEIPKKYVEGKYILTYEGLQDDYRIKLEPNIVNDSVKTFKFKLNDKLSFKDSLGNIEFYIKNFDIKNSFTIEYNFCLNDDNCLLSKEYLKPTINQNFDKVIIKLEVDYKNNSKYEYEDFYKLFEIYGDICYEVNGDLKCQVGNFERITSNKKIEKNIVYIGVNSEILDANNVKLVLNARNYRYEYILKGEI